MLIFCLLIILILIILIITIFASNSSNGCLNQFKQNKFNLNKFKRNKRKKEHYGPPPGRQPAVNHLLLGNRGWAGAAPEFNGNTASALINRVESWPNFPFQNRW